MNRLGGRHLRAALAMAAAVCAAGGTASAQRPGAPPPEGAAALPDTARLQFTAVDSLPAPLALHALADTVSFGGLLPVAWDLAVGAPADVALLPAPPPDQLAPASASRRPWWRRSASAPGPAEDPAPALAALPPAAGPRVVAWYRVYRTDPFRLEWAGRASAPVIVRGRVDDPSRVAAIRDPRAWSWLTGSLALLLAGLLLGSLLVWWWWRRRRRGLEPVDWPLPEPAWIGAALALEALAHERRLERGEPRLFLDGMAAAARRFAAGHFGVPAAELTGRELVSACAERGHGPALATAFARLIEAADLRRYDPEPPSAPWCRQQAAELIECIGAARVQPRQTPVSAERLLAAGKAWTDAVASLAGGAGDGPGAAGEDRR